MELNTPRLLLALKTKAHFDLWAQGPAAFRAATGLTVADGYPVFPEEMDASRWPVQSQRPEDQCWGAYLLVYRETQTLIGSAGFHGLPDAEGHAEIGYSIVPSYRRRGLASEAVSALRQFAAASPLIRSLGATTLAGDPASGGVLKANGFAPLGDPIEVDDPDEGRLSVQAWHLHL